MKTDKPKYMSVNGKIYFTYRKSRLLGQKVCISDKDSPYFDEWGIITGFDGKNYQVAIAENTNSQPIFLRSEFKVTRR